MAVTVGTYGATDASGWSTFTNPAVIYCISSAGNDGNPGTFASPFLTTAKAYSASLAGGNSRATWLLLRKGDTFTNQMLGPYDPTGTFGDTSGISGLQGDSSGAGNPLVWGSYDPAIDPAISGPNPVSGGARPIVKLPVTKGAFAAQGGVSGAGGDWSAFVGLDLYNWRNDPTNLSTYGFTLTALTATGGTGYAVNDIITLAASNGTTFETAKVKVGSVSGGNPTSFFFSENAGPNGFAYSGVFKASDLPNAFTQASTTGGGSGATFTNTGDLSSYTNGGAAIFSDLNPFNFFLVEDCLLRNCASNAAFWGNNGQSFQIPATGSNQYTRRSIFENNNGSHIDTSCILPWVIEECTFYKGGYNNSGNPDSVFVHNLYCSDLLRKGDIQSAGSGLLTFRGNYSIDGASADQFRAGAIATDNCWLRCPLSLSMGNVNNAAVSWQNNVFLEGKGNAVQSNAGLPEVGAYGGGYSACTGTFSITGNIATKSTDATGGTGWVFRQACTATFTNNIFYKWSPSSMSNGIGTTNNFCISLQTGTVEAVSITTPGTGYTDRSQLVTVISREAFPAQSYNSNYLVLTLGSTALINAGGAPAGASAVYLDGFTGTGAAALNGRVWLCTLTGTNQIIVFGTDGIGTVTGAGTTATVYTPYYNMAFTGGSGSGFVADVIVAGGAVVAIYLAGSEGQLAGNTHGEAGSGYSTSDVNLSVANGTADPIAGGTLTTAGTHFVAKVDAIGSVTDGGGNQYFISGGGSFPDPERTSATYIQSLGLGTTTDDFITNVLGQSKANWNPNLTANNGLNPYIRAGFLGGGVTPTPSPGRFMGNRYGVYKTRPTKIPHAS